MVQDISITPRYPMTMNFEGHDNATTKIGRRVYYKEQSTSLSSSRGADISGIGDDDEIEVLKLRGELVERPFGQILELNKRKDWTINHCFNMCLVSLYDTEPSCSS
jgi:hypothetical protein